MLRKYFILKKKKREKFLYKIKWLKKLVLRKEKIKLLRFYKKIYTLFNNLVLNKSFFFNHCFFLNLPKRQQQYTIWNLKKSTQSTFSTGKFLSKLKKMTKFYKRTHKNMATIILLLKRKYYGELKYLYLFRIKNFNYRQFIFYTKYLDLFKPIIYYFQHNQSFIPRFNPKKRIKRRILRMINAE